jgi:hypothetical protein
MDIVSVGILLTYLALVTMSQQHIADNIDLRDQTASDYSIVVQDPDPTADDPEEWRRYFSPFGHVTSVSVGVNNGALLSLLAQKRSLLMQLHREEDLEKDAGSPPMSLMERVLASAKASANLYEPVEKEEHHAPKDDSNEDWESGRGTGGGIFSKLAQQAGGLASLSPRRSSVAQHTDWAAEDEARLDDLVQRELNSEAAMSWRGKEEALAAQEASERGATDELLLGLRHVTGLFRDSKYFRAQMHSIDQKIAVQLAKGPPKVSKVWAHPRCSPPITLHHRRRLFFVLVCILGVHNFRDRVRAALGARHDEAGPSCGEAQPRHAARRQVRGVALCLRAGLTPCRRLFRFRYSNVLTMDEAPEPRDIVWCELDTTPLQLAASLLEGVVACALFVAASYTLLLAVKGSPWAVGVCVASLNMAVAPVMIAIANRERHLTHESEHVWLLGKLVLTRWCVSVVLVKSIMPFTETITEHSIQTVRAVLLCDAFFKPILQALDLPGIVDHYMFVLSNSALLWCLLSPP